ncbi:MAG: 50S ribosomal protein L15, partial [Chlamydiia bacterium]|nr:50S ribosomal protein L15 [Chlamydiia bacterium]
MTTLHSLENSHRHNKKTRRVGRGDGSQRGKTCGRGTKGMGARSGAKKRHGYEGGQMRQFMKVPIRGFSRAPFRSEFQVINLGDL